MGHWKLIGVFALLGSSMGQGDCADLKPFPIASIDDVNADGAKNLPLPISHKKKHVHKKKHGHKKKSHAHKRKRSKAKNLSHSSAKTEKILENYDAEGECNRLACSSNINRAQSCLKTKKRRNKHKKCFRAFCRYGCNDADYKANPKVFDLCNSICSSRKYQNGQRRWDKR